MFNTNVLEDLIAYPLLETKTKQWNLNNCRSDELLEKSYQIDLLNYTVNNLNCRKED